MYIIYQFKLHFRHIIREEVKHLFTGNVQTIQRKIVPIKN